MPGNLPLLGASLDQGLLKPPQLCPRRRCSDVTRTVCGRMEPNLPSRLSVSHLLLRLTSPLPTNVSRRHVLKTPSLINCFHMNPHLRVCFWGARPKRKERIEVLSPQCCEPAGWGHRAECGLHWGLVLHVALTLLVPLQSKHCFPQGDKALDLG